MVIFPPVYFGSVIACGIGPNGHSRCYHTEGPYGFLFDDSLIIHMIGYDVLLIQCAVVVIIAAGLIYIFRDKKPKAEQKE